MACFLNPRWWQRLRHAKGFGIHSPFAFRLITEVLNEKTPYYCYGAVDSWGGPVPAGDLKLLVRLLSRFRPERVALVCAAPERRNDYERLVRMADSRVRFVSPEESDFIIADLRSRAEADALAHLLKIRPVTTIVYHDGVLGASWAEALSAQPYGMSFANRRTRSFFAALPHLPRQDFHVRY